MVLRVSRVSMLFRDSITDFNLPSNYFYGLKCFETFECLKSFKGFGDTHLYRGS